MANQAVTFLSFLNNTNTSGNVSTQTVTNRQDGSTLFSNVLQNQVHNRNTREAPQTAQPETRPSKDSAPARNRPEAASRPAPRPAPEQPSSGAQAGSSAESATPSPSSPDSSKPAADNTGGKEGGQDAQTTDDAADSGVPNGVLPDEEGADETTAAGSAVLIIGAAVTAPQEPQAASLAAMVAQIADRLARSAGNGKADAPSNALTSPSVADPADQTADEGEADLAQLLTSQQNPKGKPALPPLAEAKAGDAQNGKQGKTAFAGGDSIIAALRNHTQSLNTRTLSFADIPANPASSTAAPQADLPPGTLQAAGYNPGLRTEQATMPQLQVHTPAGQRVWAEDVGSKLIWMVGRNESKAELVLTPPNLGKLGVSIHTNGDQTSAHFVAATPAAREALEQAMPRLREMLQQAGINLGQTDVSTPNEQQAGEDKGQTRRWSGNDNLFQESEHTAEALHGMTTQSRWISSGNGMVDIFA